ncbi:MAG: hypothetical protein EPN68_07960, partial [Rhodanobacter sp.]
MHYRLRENISCCDVDGHLIFLDIAQDRYFKLTGALEKAMRRFLVHENVAPALMGSLATAQILVETSDPAAHATTANIQLPTCSAIEQPAATSNRRLSAAIVVEVMATVWWVRHQLKTRALKTILETAGAYRDRKTGTHEIAASTDPEDNLLRANEQFARARRYVPIEPICLLDSLSLLRFLSRRG